MPLSGEGRIKNKLSLFLGELRKKEFIKFIYSNKFSNYPDKFISRGSVDIELVTFVNSASFPDMMLSILSFMNFAGLPRKWTLYTDDDFSSEQVNILSKWSFIKFENWDAKINEEDKKKYFKKWQLRKFAAYAAHELNGSTIYADSDIIFYSLFNKYVADFNRYNWYLPEPAEANNIDHDLEKTFNFKKIMYTVNAGFFIINTPPNWSLGLEYLDFCSASNVDNYFLDQSALNLMFYHDQYAKILDPRVFHASANDQFWFSGLKTGEFAIRHYVGLIRHKMWQLGWRKYLNK